MSHPGKFRALLATARIANVPSVVSNVWVGIAIVSMASYMDPEPFKIACLFVSGISLYISGNFLNDWYDRHWDASHRPERALPGGLFKPSAYLTTALIFMAIGLGLSLSVNWLSGLVAFIICSLIWLYTVVHKREAWSVIPMGLCRALLVYLGVGGTIEIEELIKYYPSEFTTRIIFASAVAAVPLFLHIVGLSLNARREAKGNSGLTSTLPWLFLLVPMPIGIVSVMFASETDGLHWGSFTGALVYLLWILLCHTLFRKSVSSYVSALLAAIPLVDWIFLSPFAIESIFGNPPLASSDHDFYWVLGSLVIPPIAFVSGCLLQRLAPAT